VDQARGKVAVWQRAFEVYNPELDATIVIAMNSDKKVNGEQ